MDEPPPPTIDPTNPSIHRWPDLGLTLIHDFITPAEEAAMIAAFHAVTPDTPTSKKRISQHYGHHFDYTTFGVTTHPTPLPAYISSLLPRLPLFPDRITTPPQGTLSDDDVVLPDQFTVQYYPPGAGIPPHVDTHSLFGEALYSLSYGSAVPMVFRRAGPNEARKLRLPKRSLLGGAAAPAPVTEPEGQHPSWELMLPARSLLVMTGKARYGYVHGIKGRKTDMGRGGEAVVRRGRYSITMRSVRRGEQIGCECKFPGVCDARVREEEAAGVEQG